MLMNYERPFFSFNPFKLTLAFIVKLIFININFVISSSIGNYFLTVLIRCR